MWDYWQTSVSYPCDSWTMEYIWFFFKSQNSGICCSCKTWIPVVHTLMNMTFNVSCVTCRPLTSQCHCHSPVKVKIIIWVISLARTEMVAVGLKSMERGKGERRRLINSSMKSTNHKGCIQDTTERGNARWPPTGTRMIVSVISHARNFPHCTALPNSNSLWHRSAPILGLFCRPHRFRNRHRARREKQSANCLALGRRHVCGHLYNLNKD